jgi:hypothetical protein
MENIQLDFAAIMQLHALSKKNAALEGFTDLLMRELAGACGCFVLSLISFPNNKQKQQQFLANVGATIKHEALKTINEPDLNQLGLAAVEAFKKLDEAFFRAFFINNGGYKTLVNSRAFPELLKEIEKNSQQTEIVGCVGYIMIALDLHHKDFLKAGASLNKACFIATKSTEYRNRFQSKNAAVFERYWNKYKVVANFCIANFIHGLMHESSAIESPTFDDICQLLTIAKAIQKWLITYSPHGRMGKPLIEIEELYVLPDDAKIPDIDLRSIILPLKSSCLEVLSDYAAPTPMD